ncbi:hypothetical protein Scep_014029 [Stephania cephalantha]|uniref:glutathione transferase n=1 Tax=Stephania cephalantha TaxID=152367 RepID=A0AAP0NZZ5_9MAGN
MDEEKYVKLIGTWSSPFSKRVELALKMKGISYEYIEEDLFNKSALLFEYNPIHEKIPVLIHNGKPIVESLIITWKENPILPQDPYERAVARFLAKLIDEKCLGTLRNASWSYGEESEKLMEEARGQLRTLENELKGKRFFGGDHIGLVDIAANFIAFWVGVFQEVRGVSLINEETFPVLHEWTERFASSSVVKETLPPRDKLLSFFQARIEAMAASKSTIYK